MFCTNKIDDELLNIVCPENIDMIKKSARENEASLSLSDPRGLSPHKKEKRSQNCTDCVLRPGLKLQVKMRRKHDHPQFGSQGKNPEGQLQKKFFFAL